MERIAVKDSITGQTLLMWPADAEEALRYDTQSRYTVQSNKQPPRKNPGGRGF